jgi:ribosomal-protein-alanine acetyltransferase
MAVLDKIRDFWSYFPFLRTRQRQTPFVLPSCAQEAGEFAETFLIRPLTLSQIDELWQLDKRCFVNGEAYSRQTLEYLLGEPNNISFRAVLTSGAMIGFVIAMLEEDGTGHITTIGVAPEFRRRGIARRLLQKAEDAFRRRSVALMRLEVRAVNTGAQQLYQRAGYTTVQRLARYYSNGGDGLLMVKSIN